MRTIEGSQGVRRGPGRILVAGFLGLLIGLLAGTVPTAQASAADSEADTDVVRGVATFAGGCFWCMEPPFEKLAGVREAVSGYMGGHVVDPTYGQVSGGGTGHLEVVQIHYDPKVVTYERLLEVYWRQVDPTDDGGQFVDRGPQYRTRIFYHTERQRTLAERSKRILARSGVFQRPIVTPVAPADTFYRAEKYHQNYYRTHSYRYRFYRSQSGRDSYLERTWKGHEDFRIFSPSDLSPKAGDTAARYRRPDPRRLREMLTPLQYRVTQKDATEPAFDNAYWDNDRPGIYVDVVSGEPLFSSRDKFKSGTGWPSFTRPLVAANIVTRPDRSWFTTRTEVRSRHADSHLGHVFDDGPPPTGKRYCINSAALEFVPVAEMKRRGYGRFLSAFSSGSGPEDD